MRRRPNRQRVDPRAAQHGQKRGAVSGNGRRVKRRVPAVAKVEKQEMTPFWKGSDRIGRARQISDTNGEAGPACEVGALILQGLQLLRRQRRRLVAECEHAVWVPEQELLQRLSRLAA